jgi:predicted TIM-barrel fold metal-dependent hydrolase
LRSIVDAHHHLWQLDCFPYKWLAPDSPPRPFGDHSILKRDYLLADYRRDMAATRLQASVFVEANAGAPEADEIEWVDQISGHSRIPAVVIGSLDLRHPQVDRILSRFLRSRRMRGVRMSLCWDERPQWRFIDRPGVMRMEEFRRGLASLTRHGLLLDALVVPSQLAELASVARANPDQSIVVNHLGTPFFETEADKTAWQGGMKDCAACGNISVKISGLWPLDRRWRPDIIGETVRFVVDRFGPDRCMWASNFPVEKIMCSVATQIDSLETVLHKLAANDLDMIFRTTAMRVYRIDTDESETFPLGELSAALAAGPGIDNGSRTRRG